MGKLSAFGKAQGDGFRHTFSESLPELNPSIATSSSFLAASPRAAASARALAVCCRCTSKRLRSFRRSCVLDVARTTTVWQLSRQLGLNNGGKTDLVHLFYQGLRHLTTPEKTQWLQYKSPTRSLPFVLSSQNPCGASRGWRQKVQRHFHKLQCPAFCLSAERRREPALRDSSPPSRTATRDADGPS